MTPIPAASERARKVRRVVALMDEAFLEIDGGSGNRAQGVSTEGGHDTSRGALVATAFGSASLRSPLQIGKEPLTQGLQPQRNAARLLLSGSGRGTGSGTRRRHMDCPLK